MRYRGSLIVAWATLFAAAALAAPGVRWTKIAKEQLEEGGPGLQGGPPSRYATPIAALPNGSLVVSHGYYYGAESGSTGNLGAQWLDDTWMHTRSGWTTIKVGKGRYVPAAR